MKPNLPIHKLRDKRITLRFSDEELSMIYTLLDIKLGDNISTKIRNYLIENYKNSNN